MSAIRSEMKLRKKLAFTLALLVCVVALVAQVGKKMIESSAAYEMAMVELQNLYAVNSSELSIPYLRPFKFSEGEYEGSAEFSLCDSHSTCYQIQAQKRLGIWRISSVLPPTEN